MISKIQSLVEKLVKHKVLMALVLLLGSIGLLFVPTIVESILGAPGENDYPWLNFLGSFHPLFLHLPIGVTILVFSLEILGLFTKDYKFNMTLPLIFNAMAAIMASLFGIIWYYGGDFTFVKDSMLDDHMWRGLIYASIVIWLPWVYNNIKVKITYYFILVGSVAMMSLAAHDGGTLVHDDPFDKAPWLDENKKKAKGDPVVENADPVVYQDIIVPILKQKCYACHHNDKKIKSGLSLESIEKMLEGGDEDVALVKGDASKSPMITSIEHMPIDDDEHMPPKKKTQVTAEELQILKWWVNSGAPETEKVSELEVPDDIRALLGAKRTADVNAGGHGHGNDHGTHSANSTPGVNPKNSPLAGPVEGFLKKYPNALSWTSLSDSTLYFSAASQRASYGDSDLDALEPFVSELDELNFNGSQVTDKLSGLVVKSVKLRVLKVAGTKVTDGFVKNISDHPTLETLVLHTTGVSDAAIDDLGKIKSLKKLFIWKSKISKEGAAKLKKLLPECEIISGM